MAAEIAIPFAINSAGGFAVIDDPVSSAAQHLSTYVTTLPRERVMRPFFGTRVLDLLFDLNNVLDLALLQADISKAVGNDVPNVSLKSIAINPAPTGNVQDGAVAITMQFTVQTESTLTSGLSGQAIVVLGGTS